MNPTKTHAKSNARLNKRSNSASSQAMSPKRPRTGAVPLTSSDALQTGSPGSATSHQAGAVTLNVKTNSNNPNPHGPSTSPVPTGRKSLWEDVLDELRLESHEKETLKIDEQLKLSNNIESLMSVVEEEHRKYKKKHRSIKIMNKTVDFDGLFRRVTSWLDAFKAAGDTAIQYDPAHAALPWALFRLLLDVRLLGHTSMLKAKLT